VGRLEERRGAAGGGAWRRGSEPRASDGRRGFGPTATPRTMTASTRLPPPLSPPRGLCPSRGRLLRLRRQCPRHTEREVPASGALSPFRCYSSRARLPRGGSGEPQGGGEGRSGSLALGRRQQERGTILSAAAAKPRSGKWRQWQRGAGGRCGGVATEATAGRRTARPLGAPGPDSWGGSCPRGHQGGAPGWGS